MVIEWVLMERESKVINVGPSAKKTHTSREGVGSWATSARSVAPVWAKLFVARWPELVGDYIILFYGGSIHHLAFIFIGAKLHECL